MSIRSLLGPPVQHNLDLQVDSVRANRVIAGNDTDGGYNEFQDTSEPSSVPGSGKLYKKSGDPGLYWKGDGSPEVNLATAGSGVDTMTAFGGAPNANGATIAGDLLTLQPAAAGFPGGVSTSAQTFDGAKTFSGGVVTDTVDADGADGVKVDGGTRVKDSTIVATEDQLTFDNTVTFGDPPAPNTVQIISRTQSVQRNLALQGYGGGTINAADFHMTRARGTIAAPTVVADGDLISVGFMSGYDGDGYIGAVAWRAYVDGPVANNKMPGRFAIENRPALAKNSTGGLIQPENAGNRVFQVRADQSVEISSGPLYIGGIDMRPFPTSTSYPADAGRIFLQRREATSVDPLDPSITIHAPEAAQQIVLTSSATSRVENNGAVLVEGAANVGAGTGTLFRDKTDSSAVLNFKSLLAGTNISIANNADTVEISAMGGVTAMTAFGSAPNANGATIAGSNLTLQPASASFPGGVTTGAQTFAGTKTFSGGIVTDSVLPIGVNGVAVDGVAIGSGPNSVYVGTDVAGQTDWVMVGFDSGNPLATGTGNVGVGRRVLEALTSGANNVAIGRNSGILLTSGSENTHVGALSAPNTATDTSGTAIGYAATAGNYATSIGHSTAATGDFSIVVGFGVNTIVPGRIILGDTTGTNNTSLQVGAVKASSGSQYLQVDTSGIITPRPGATVYRDANFFDLSATITPPAHKTDGILTTLEFDNNKAIMWGERIPFGYTAASAITVKVYWYVSTTTLTVDWSLQYRKQPIGGVRDTTFASFATSTPVPGTANTIATSTMTIAGAGLAVGNVLALRLSRTATGVGKIDVLGVEIVYA